MASLADGGALQDEPRYMKRKVKNGGLKIDKNRRALIVLYEVEATVLGKFGDSMQVERKKYEKVIKLRKALTENTNVPRLAEKVMEQCKLIPPGKLAEVEELLQKLQRHIIRDDQGADSHSKMTKEYERKKSRKKREARKRREAEREAEKLAEVSMGE